MSAPGGDGVAASAALQTGQPDPAASPWRPGTLQLASLPPLSLYVHLPWCMAKCPYCDFNSHAAPAGRALPERDYLAALRSDLESALPLIWGRRVISVFIGGGTPSLFTPQAIESLIADIRARVPLEPGAEITLEANPGTFEAQRFQAFREAGVTRLSIGVQSFDDAALARIGRVHDGRQARAAVDEAARAFETFNIDLMYALPGQSVEALERDLATALGYQPPHLSVYHLTLEPNTWFASHPPVLPDEDTAAEMLDRITARTSEAGLQRYEVSAFAEPGHRCRHNLNYWQFGDYLGIGAGAHGKLSFAHRIVRQVRWREPARYIEQALAGAAVSNETEVTRDQLPFEFMLNALRLREGFALEDYASRTGLPLSSIDRGVEAALAKGLLSAERDGIGRLVRVQPTDRGFDFLSDLQQLFLPASRAVGLRRGS
jgi:oxygen-independent coproporphyrinogen-3 oxidase